MIDTLTSNNPNADNAGLVKLCLIYTLLRPTTFMPGINGTGDVEVSTFVVFFVKPSMTCTNGGEGR